MQVAVKHNSQDITNHVIRYDREHKLCTGIGLIEIEVEYSYSGTFDPWDSIDIYENGSHTGSYNVSSVSEGQPSATFVISGQDESKRLSDYFISDSYIVDYPSYTRYWIELFLDEVGINYTFLTESQGSLLSNNTSLGLTTAYEQVLMLLQMSGWYITFKPSGMAVIGKLENSLANGKMSLGRNSVIEIKTIKNDSMLRNRVVVWGHGDPTTSRWAFADVSVNTKWNYDDLDKRTIVIANSNVPTVAAAFLLANRALTEFAKLTVEKHLTVAGAKDLLPGDIISVQTKIFSGKGLVTTFGTSMSRTGLVTNIVLDERCPRLFGFFDFGGYVYVGTFGSGVWRKHIKTWSGFLSSGWSDYSSGLMDMNVTDLHVNAGALACVTSSGDLYYNLENEGPWSGIPLSGLQVTYSGILLEETVYSGLMGRACIIDRDTNSLRYAVDNSSGVNLGDFLMDTDPLDPHRYAFFLHETPSGLLDYTTILSGIAISGLRAWVIDANAYDGVIENTYSVITSGLILSGVMDSPNYNYLIHDIENDGTHDYIEAMTIGSGRMPSTLINGQYGQHTLTGPGNIRFFPFDSRLHTTMSYSGFPSPVLQELDTEQTGTIISSDRTFAFYDELPEGKAYVAFPDSFGTVILRVFEISEDSGGNLSSVTYTKDLGISTTALKILSVERVSLTGFKFYGRRTISGTDYLAHYTYEITTDTVVELILISLPAPGGMVRKNYLYSTEVVSTDGGNGFEISAYRVDVRTGETIQSTILDVDPLGNGSTNGDITYSTPAPVLLPFGEDNIIMLAPFVKKEWVQPGDQFYSTLRRYYMRGFNSEMTEEQIYDWSNDFGLGNGTNGSNVAFVTGRTGNFNRNRIYSIYFMTNSIQITDFIDSQYITLGSSSSKLFDYALIYNYHKDVDNSIARKTDGTFAIINSYTADVVTPINHPTGYTLYSYSANDSLNGELFFRAFTGAGPATTLNSEMISLGTVGGNVTRRTHVTTATTSHPENMVGNLRYFFQGASETFTYMKPGPMYGKFPLFLVLQRDGSDFNIVKSGIYEDRLDISNYSPLVTMDRRVASLETYFISPDESVLQNTHLTMSGHSLGGNIGSGYLFSLGVLADDFRYSDFETTVESGTSRQIYVVYSGGIGYTDAYTLDNFSGLYYAPSGIPSGYVNRLEISNYFLPDQYVFASVSGLESTESGWGFYQKDPSGVFVDFSLGYPQARTTIIRLDDRL